MGLNKATGDMYGWVTDTHTHLRGACSHACPYCYARTGRARRYYDGPQRLEFKELMVGYGSRDGTPKTIFVEHMSDLCAAGVSGEWISLILQHCCGTPENTYVFQTRNLARLADWMRLLPPHRLIGTTVETDNYYHAVCNAPNVLDRLHSIGWFRRQGERTFVTVEPVIRFSAGFAARIIEAAPAFVNIGADSKGFGLVEPGAAEVAALVESLESAGVEVRLKPNLARLLKGHSLAGRIKP